MATDGDRIRSIFEELESEETQEYLNDSEDNVILKSGHCCESEQTDMEIRNSQVVWINSPHCIDKDKKEMEDSFTIQIYQIYQLTEHCWMIIQCKGSR